MFWDLKPTLEIETETPQNQVENLKELCVELHSYYVLNFIRSR